MSASFHLHSGVSLHIQRYTGGVNEATRVHIRCPVTDYAAEMPPVRRTTQHTVGVDDELWDDCMDIAKARRETLSQVIRSALRTYREENARLLRELRTSDAEG